ncbi:hypothetical protein ACL02R_21890 [Streptomyces sp. MS19]|uniref:hypothetical protein n=1 Tax=Streptomyces sp. MS19 TaxID=3385972 RepID=UPI0039A01ADC
MGKILWLQTADGGEKDKRGAGPPDGGVRHAIWVAPDREARRRYAAQVLACPEVWSPPAAKGEWKRGVRAFTLWQDRQRTAKRADVVTRAAGPDGQAVYEVLGAAGEPLARVTRVPASALRRARWTVETADGRSATGRKGNPFWWTVWWLVSPIQLLLLLAALLGGDVARPPRRTKWRTAEGVVLDWASGGRDFELTEVAGEWDPRVTAALIALLLSHEGWLGDNWARPRG